MYTRVHKHNCALPVRFSSLAPKFLYKQLNYIITRADVYPAKGPAHPCPRIYLLFLRVLGLPEHLATGLAEGLMYASHSVCRRVCVRMCVLQYYSSHSNDQRRAVSANLLKLYFL